MHKLTTLFLYAFLADGLLSVADIASRQGTPGTLPDPLAVGVSLAVLLLGVVLFVGMVFTPRLSKRLLLPPLLFLGFTVVWSLVFGDKDILTLSVAESLLALGLIVGFWKQSGSGIQDFTSNRPLFTFKNFAFTALLNGTICMFIAALMILSFAQKLRYKCAEATNGYVTIQPGGISLEERTFQRGDREIRLISMIHIAKSGFYDEVAKALPATATAVVLLEGISDREHHLSGKLDYSNFAQWIGVASQKESSFSAQAAKGIAEAKTNRAEGKEQTNLEYQCADVDIADFKPDTIRWMQAVAHLFDSSSFREIIQKYSEVSKTLELGNEAAFAEVLTKRNAHLLGEIHNALETHTTVVVPWGAKHMPGLQSEIEKWGFVETARAQHQAVRFQNKTLVGFLALVDRMPVEED